MIESPQHPDFRLLPRRIDWIARHDPTRIYAKIPQCPDNVPAGFETVTFVDLADAINRASWWLSTYLDEEDKSFAYWGPSDLRWSILLAAAIKTGKLMIHASPWARLEGLFDFFHECKCSVIICDMNSSSDASGESPFANINTVRPEHRSIKVPSLQDWLRRSSEPQNPFECSQTWEKAADRPVACFHTSGITQQPKPVVWTNRRIASWSSMLETARKDPTIQVPDVVGKTIFNTFIPAHMEGHNFQFFLPVYMGNIVVLKHHSQTLNSNVIRQIMIHSSCDGIIASPGIFAQLIGCSRSLALLRSLKTIIIGGTGLSEECHSMLQHPGVNVQTIYLQNHGFPYLQKHHSVKDSRYVGFHEISGVNFRAHTCGHMELVVQCNRNWMDYNVGFEAWSDLERHATGDLFSRHPFIPDRWKFRGRANQTIVLKNGEAFDVSRMEKRIETHPLVKSAIVFGELRSHPLLVIEPWSDVMDSLKSGQYKDEFLDEVWRCVEEANETSASVGHLNRQLTLVMRMPLVRTIQHQIDRMRTWEMLKDEVKELYTAYEKGFEEFNHDKFAAKPVKSRGAEMRENLRRVQAFRELNPLQW